MSSLRDRVAIVTGGAQGIGRAYCLGLAKEGAAIAVADMADPSSTVEAITQAGGEAFGVDVDVSDRLSTEEMARTVHERFGRIDILINNAAFFKKATVGPWYDLTDDEWELAMAVNVRGVFLCCRAVHPYMKKAGYGKIINISSTVAWEGIPGFLHYVASKSALIGLTRSLAREVGDDGIRVNTLAPDLIPDEEILAKQGVEVNEAIVANRSLKRTQVPEDMVGAALFFAGPKSDFITGQSLIVNGGLMFE